MSSGHRVAQSFLALGSGEAISRFIAFGVTIYLARILGPEGYGVVALAIGVNLYLAKVADFGIEAAGSREIAAAPERLRSVASAVMSTRLLVAGMLTAVAILAARMLLPAPENMVLPLFFLTLIPIAASTKWIHMGLGHAQPVGGARVLGELIVLSLVVLSVRGIQNLSYVPLAQLAGDAVVALLLFGLLFLRGEGFGLRWDPATAWPVLWSGAPLFIQLALGLFLYNSDLLFLRFFRDSETVGYYAAAYTPISFAANLGMAYGLSLLPAMSRLGQGTPEESGLFQKSLSQVYAVCIPVTAGLCLLAQQVIRLGFGEGYQGSILALQILAWSIPFSVLRYVPWVALVSRGRGYLQTRPMLWSVLANLALNTLLVPRFGMVGAGLATVTSEALCCALMLAATKSDGLSLIPAWSLWRPSAAVAVMGASLLMIGPLPLVPGVLLGAAVFGGVLLVLRAVGGVQHVFDSE